MFIYINERLLNFKRFIYAIDQNANQEIPGTEDLIPSCVDPADVEELPKLPTSEIWGNLLATAGWSFSLEDSILNWDVSKCSKTGGKVR
jgi:hypothetical protein